MIISAFERVVSLMAADKNRRITYPARRTHPTAPQQLDRKICGTSIAFIQCVVDGMYSKIRKASFVFGNKDAFLNITQII